MIWMNFYLQKPLHCFVYVLSDANVDLSKQKQKMAEEKLVELKATFYKRFNETMAAKKGINTSFLDEEKYQKLVTKINALKSGHEKKQASDYQLLKRYDVFRI